MSLTETPVDAMAISFYKMFGFPTGVGALIAKESFLAQLTRPWFAGGTVDVVQAPGTLHTMAADIHEQFEVSQILSAPLYPFIILRSRLFHAIKFYCLPMLTAILYVQDGTINYLNLPAITDGLRFLSAYLPFLPLRLSTLTDYLITSLTQLRHESTGTPVVRVLSRPPTRRLKSVGEQAGTGSVISLIFLSVRFIQNLTRETSFTYLSSLLRSLRETCSLCRSSNTPLLPRISPCGQDACAIPAEPQPSWAFATI